jgi:hypothetical protein
LTDVDASSEAKRQALLVETGNTAYCHNWLGTTALSTTTSRADVDIILCALLSIEIVLIWMIQPLIVRLCNSPTETPLPALAHKATHHAQMHKPKDS